MTTSHEVHAVQIDIPETAVADRVHKALIDALLSQPNMGITASIMMPRSDAERRMAHGETPEDLARQMTSLCSAKWIQRAAADSRFTLRDEVVRDAEHGECVRSTMEAVVFTDQQFGALCEAIVRRVAAEFEPKDEGPMQ